MEPKQVCIVTPVFGALDPEHERAVRKLPKGVQIVRQHGCSAIDQARALCAAIALQTTADVLFWIDADIVFDPHDVERLAELCLDGYSIIGGAYAKKRPGDGITVRFKPGTRSPIPFFNGGEVIEVDGLGFGFLAIDRAVFDKMAPHYPSVNMLGEEVRGWFLPEIAPERGRYLSEDYAFLERAQRLGEKIWLDTSVRLLHKGTYAYGLEDAGMIVPQADQLQVTVPPSVEPEDLLTGLPDLLDKFHAARAQCSDPKNLYPVDHASAAYLALRARGKTEIGEAGCGTGYSAACLASGGAQVRSFDENYEWRNKARANLAKLEWANVVFDEMTDEAVFPYVHLTFDLFFIDSTDETRFKVLPSLVKQGLVNAHTEILIHDAHRARERAVFDNWVKLFPGSHWEIVFEAGRGVARFYLP